MAKHTITYREEMRPGTLIGRKQIRVICACGFEDTAPTENSARIIIGKHLKSVVNEIKPQKSLDI